MGWGSSSRSSSVDLTTSQNTTVTIRNSWVETRGPRARPHWGQKLGRPVPSLPHFGHVAMAGVYGRSGERTVLLVTVPATGGNRVFETAPASYPVAGNDRARSGCGGAGAQAQCAGLRAGAAAPGAGRRAGAGPGAARRRVAGAARAGRRPAGAP